MINRENLVKIGRAGGKTSNRETPDQIGRVGISGSLFGNTFGECVSGVTFCRCTKVRANFPA